MHLYVCVVIFHSGAQYAEKAKLPKRIFSLLNYILSFFEIFSYDKIIYE